MELNKAQGDLQVLLRVLAALFLGAGALYWLGGVLPLGHPLFRFLPLVSNSVVKVWGLGLCCLYAAGNLRERQGLVSIVMAGHGVSILAMLVLLLLCRPLPPVLVGPWSFDARVALWSATALDGAILLILLRFYVPAMSSTPAPKTQLQTKAEAFLLVLLRIIAVAFAFGALIYEAAAFLGALRPYALDLPFVTNSVVKVAVLGMVARYVTGDLRGRMAVVGIFVAVHVVSVLSQIAYLIVLGNGAIMAQSVGSAWTSESLRAALFGGVVLDTFLTALVFVAYQRAWTARFGLHFLRPMEFRSLMALSEVLIEGPEKPVEPQEIAHRVDGYIARIHAKRRWIHRAALFGLEIHPLLTFKPPLSQLDANLRLEHLKTKFFKPWTGRWLRNPLRTFTQAGIRVGQQLSYLGYYSAPAVHPTIGYQKFSDRPRRQALQVPDPQPLPLEVQFPARGRRDDTRECEICIIGSGAAGSILAHELTANGHDVVIVERGRFVEPRFFSEDEVDMIGRLYADGVFQQTEDFQFTVLQGSCVGGSTVVNNAVCFDPPADVLQKWNDPKTLDAGLDLRELGESLRYVRHLLSIQEQRGNLNPSGEVFLRGARTDGRLESRAVDANIDGCLGCGYCNIGCAYGRKLSMLDRVLPEAQRTGHLRILAECPIDELRVLSGHRQRVFEAVAHLDGGRTVRIRAKRFIVSSGAIASSFLLQESGIGQRLPVGKYVSFNMGAAVTAEFADGPPLRSYDGLQISHFGRPEPSSGYVYETWFNPPVAQALNMPGWFNTHYSNMRRYDRLMAVGVLVGTDRTGTIGKALLGGPALNFQPSTRDREVMGKALERLGGLLMDAGASKVMLNAWGYEAFRSRSELHRIPTLAQRSDYLTFGSGHPQGGNAISRDTLHGVVGPDFRVHGTENLYVCDASVIPSSLTVNPQLTIMGLAHYAARQIQNGRQRH